MALDVAPLPIGQPRAVDTGIIAVPEGIIVDIDDGASFTIDQNGPHAVRTAYVWGLRGSPAARLYYATMAPGMPRYGEYHPVVPFLPVSRVQADLIKGTTDQATVTINYDFATGGSQYFMNEPGDTIATLPQLEILTTVQPARTQFEIDPATGIKKQIVVSYIDIDHETGTETLVEQGGSVEYMLPMETVRYMRREARDPQHKAREYIGTINVYNVFGDSPHMWMCTRLGGPSDDGGATFNVTYEFQRHPDSWDPVVVPTDPETGQPRVLSDVDAALIRPHRIYDLADFWTLNLTLPPAPGDE